MEAVKPKLGAATVRSRISDQKSIYSFYSLGLIWINLGTRFRPTFERIERPKSLLAQSLGKITSQRPTCSICDEARVLHYSKVGENVFLIFSSSLHSKI
jgi:hypothetical protein